MLAIAEVGGQLAVQFKHHGLWCLYPGTMPLFYDLMLAWPSKGHSAKGVLVQEAALSDHSSARGLFAAPKLFQLSGPGAPAPEGGGRGFCQRACLGRQPPERLVVAVYGGPGGNYPCEWWGDFLDYCPGQEAVAWRVMRAVADDLGGDPARGK